MYTSPSILDSVLYVMRILHRNKRYYAATLVICIALTALTTWSIPNMYASQVKIVDEHKEMGLYVGLDHTNAWIVQNAANLSQDTGINNPEIYNMLLSSDNFILSLSQKSISKFKGITLYEYLQKYDKKAWWQKIADSLQRPTVQEKRKEILSAIKKRLQYSYDFRKDITTIQYTDNDKEVSAEVASAAAKLLQDYIIRNKGLVLKEKTNNAIKAQRVALSEYNMAKRAYTRFSDTHQDIITPSEKSKLEMLSQERDNTFKTYREACKKRYHEEYISMQRNFSFHVIQHASVPLSPVKPTPLIYLVSYLIIGFILTAWYVLYCKS